MLMGYSRNFWLLSVSMFLFMTSFNLIMPELNGFLSQLGGGHLKGAIILFFSVAALLARPFAGRLADTVGRNWVFTVGCLIAIATSFAYLSVSSILFFFMLRFIHGLSAGFAPTGATALLTDLIPEGKRGAAMGIWGTFVSLGIGAGHSVGSIIADKYGFTVLFGSAAALGICSLILSLGVRETLTTRVQFSFALLRIKWTDVIDPDVKPVALVMSLTAICSGMVFVLTPDLSQFLGISNKGFFFSIYVLSTLFIRLFLGSISDRYGRQQVLIFSSILLVTSMVLLALSTDLKSYTIAALVFGLATGFSSPTLFAWTADLSAIERRGVGAGTLFIALEIGILGGSGISLFTYSNTLESAKNTLFIGAVSAFLALLYLSWSVRRGSDVKKNAPHK
jgi:MFS family permease